MHDPQDPTPHASAEPAAAQVNVAAPGWERETLERLAFASLREQQTARRWKNGLRLAWLLLLASLFWAGWSYNTPASSPSAPHTAMVAIRGEIAAEGDASAENIIFC